LAVARDLGRYFLMASAVSPGQVVKKFFSIAWIQVEIAGLEHARLEKINELNLCFLVVRAVGTMLVGGVLGWEHHRCSRGFKIDEPHPIGGIAQTND
jgi:hypothetical protein